MDKALRRKYFAKGAGAMVPALVLLYFVSSLFPVVVYPPARLGALVRDRVPGDIVTLAIEQGVKLANRLGWEFLEHAALMALTVGVHLAALAAGGIASVVINEPVPSPDKVKRTLLATSLLVALACLLALGAPEGLPAFSIVIYLVAGYTFAKLAGGEFLSPLPQPSIDDDETPLDAIRRSRRRFLRRSAGAAAAAVVGGTVLRQLKLGRPDTNVRIVEADERFKAPPDDPIPAIKGQTLEITPTEDFYNIDINITKPVINHETWRLKIHGLVNKPFELTYRQLQTQFNVVEMASTLACVSNEVGGDLVSTAVWRGVRLKDVLQTAGVEPAATELIFRGAEGYSDSITLEKGLESTTLIAFGMNGEALPVQNGFPARIIVPGIYGMKNVKWLTGIEATDRNYQGYWQTRGWSDSALVKTQSRIDVPKSGARAGPLVQFAGVAWAGDRRISRVEVSSDGGRSWNQAVLRRELSPNSWRLWSAQESGLKPGSRRILVRAIDGLGSVQEARRTRTHPSGASGLDSVRVVIKAQEA